jgi:hypothetical protein
MKYQCKILSNGTKVCKPIKPQPAPEPEPEPKTNEKKEEKEEEVRGSVRRVIIEFNPPSEEQDSEVDEDENES